VGALQETSELRVSRAASRRVGRPPGRPGYLLREVFLFVVRLPPFFAPFFVPFFLAIRSSSHPNVSLPGGA
jgi:hypothetical protein